MDENHNFHDFGLRRLLNAFHGRPHCNAFSCVTPEYILLCLNGLNNRDMMGKLENYGWKPKNKRIMTLTPKEASEILHRKLVEENGKSAIGFEVDHLVYYGKYGGRKHIFEIYKRYVDYPTGKKVRLHGKEMKLEFLVA